MPSPTEPPATRRPSPRRLAVALVVGVLVLAGAVVVRLTAPADEVPGAGSSPTPTGAEPAPEPEPEPLPTFPDATTTGVPEGTVLEPSESLRITEDGTVIDGLDILGTVTVEADDVVIRNTRIRNTGTFAIRVSGGRNLLVEDSEIDGQGRGAAAVAFNGYTLRRVDIHHVTEGPRIAGGNVTIEDSYIHHLVQAGDNHTDAVQVVSGSGIVLRGNTLLALNEETGALGNAAFQFGEDDGPVSDCLVEGNYLNGGNYTVNGGGGGTTGAACTFRANRFGPDHRYGPVANLGPNSVWDAANVWHVTGDPVR